MKRLFLLLCFSFYTFGLHAKTELIFWHAMEGYIAEKLTEIIEGFNQKSQDYHVKLVRVGDYAETANKALQAFENDAQPHIVQIYEVGTQTMIQMHHMFKPVHELLQKYDHTFDPDTYINVVRNFYSTLDNTMLSLPWNASTGVLFYNKDAFEKAGLNPSEPPQTWHEVEKCCQQLKKYGYIGFTAAWPVAYHLEHVCNIHNLPLASHENGFDGLKARLICNTKKHAFHLEHIAKWQKEGFFAWHNSNADAEASFTNGTCAILLQGANRYALLKRNAQFDIGAGFMPYWPELSKKPYNLNIGGASLWAMAGFSEHEYQGVAALFSYLSQTNVQTYWHKATGYLPISKEAYKRSKEQQFYQDNPAAEIAVLSVTNNTPNTYPVGIRLGNYIEIRYIIEQYIKAAILGNMDPLDALKQATKEGNKLLVAYEQKFRKKNTI